MLAFKERKQDFIVFMDNPKIKFEELEATMGSLHPLVSRIAEYLQLPQGERGSHSLAMTMKSSSQI